MTTSTKRLVKGFTLIELLTVIAIIGILAAIIIPTVGKVRETAQRSVASSNLRQVGQASLIYASDNKDKFPGAGAKADTLAVSTNGGSLYGVAFQLAYQGGLNDASIWFASPELPTTAISTVKNDVGTGISTFFTSPNYLSYSYIGGLNVANPSTTPIAFTHGLKTDSKWATATPTTSAGSPWNGDGGHIVFLGGNVAWYRDLKGSNALVSRNGATTEKLDEALPVAPAATGVGIYRGETPSATQGANL